MEKNWQVGFVAARIPAFCMAFREEDAKKERKRALKIEQQKQIAYEQAAVQLSLAQMNHN